MRTGIITCSTRSGAPRPLEGHHRFNGLVMQEFSLEEEANQFQARKVLGNEDAVNWLREGPHILKADGWYYIACAEGGTGRRHRIRMVRSRELWARMRLPQSRSCARGSHRRHCARRGMATSSRCPTAPGLCAI